MLRKFRKFLGRNKFVLFDKAYLPADFLYRFIFLFVKHNLILFKQVATMGINGDNQWTSMIIPFYSATRLLSQESTPTPRGPTWVENTTCVLVFPYF